MQRIFTNCYCQVLGVADTGLDMDNCQFWESANDPSFPQRGLGPLDNGLVDFTRRKVPLRLPPSLRNALLARLEARGEERRPLFAKSGCIHSEGSACVLF